MLVTRVRHPSMPEPQVSDHDITPPGLGLHRRSHLAPRTRGLLGDPRDSIARAVDFERKGRRLGEHLLVLVGGVDVRAQPELGGAVFYGKVAQGNIGDKVVRVLGVVKGRVFMYILPEAGGVGYGGVGGQPVPDGFLAKVAGASVSCFFTESISQYKQFDESM